MNLVWKLLRHHISIAQTAGFFFANLLGMFIVLLGFQFYHDVLPCFTAEDSFMKSDYMVISRKIGASNVISGKTNTFSPADIADLGEQPFAKAIGAFVSNEYHVDASMGISGTNILNSEIFLESVPDSFVDVAAATWHYTPGDRVVPILLPRSYITMYNFGFAKTHSLPKISDGVVGMIDMTLFVQGNGRHEEFKGRVIGFSGKVTSVLVPESFMKWSNATFAPGKESDPSRLLLKVGNPADETIAKYMDAQGYEMDADKLNAEKTTYFLKLVIGLVVSVGVLISILSFYILMLSIYLLVQKNSDKLENLLLIGYSTKQVARPYQWLATGLNMGVLVLAAVAVVLVRSYYMDILLSLYPTQADTGLLAMLVLGAILFALVTILNFSVVHHRIKCIWEQKRRNN